MRLLMVVSAYLFRWWQYAESGRSEYQTAIQADLGS